MRNQSYKIAFIGTGKAATTIAPILEKAGHTIQYIQNRTPEKAKKLQASFLSPPVIKAPADFNFSDTDCQVCFLSVTDTAISKILFHLLLPQNCVLLHLSGTTEIKVLENQVTAKLKKMNTENRGVFWVVKALNPQHTVSLQGTPIIIDYTNEYTQNVLENLCNSIQAKPIYYPDGTRMALHLAATIGGNFLYHIMHFIHQIMKAENLPFEELILPIIEEALKKSKEKPDLYLQTGPALRNDLDTLFKHISIGDKYDVDAGFKELYEGISKSIQIKAQNPKWKS
ncbi:MAG: DUF2520 domain-containing protein [Chitinophagaceae bacterium]|nr:DUF2520 domain-containing protein [Chitinophagaceae bacterium]